MKQKINWLVPFLLLPLWAGAQEIALDSILSVISRNHPMLAEYRLRATAFNAYAEGSTAWMAPMAGVGTFMTPYPGQRPDEMDKGAVMVSVEQSIPNRAKARAGQKALSAKAAAEEARALQQWNALRYEARRAVYQWSVASEQLTQLQQQEKVLLMMLDIARLRYREKQGSPAAIYQAEGKIAGIRNRITELETMQAESVAMLRSLMQLPDGTDFRPKPSIPEFDPLRLAEDSSQLSSRRSDVIESDEKIRQMRLAQDWQKLQNKPDYRLRFDHMQPLGNSTPVQFTAMAMVSIPIAPWSSRMYRAEVAGMEREIASMQQGKAATLLEARSKLTTLTIRLTGLRKQLERYESEIIPALNRNMEALMTAYSENREALTMVLEAWEELTMAHQEYLETKERYYLLITDYEKTAEL